MNPANHCHLEGSVVGECWTRYSPRKRGQVRFWLLSGDQVLLCAIEPPAIAQVPFLETEIYGSRTLSIDAVAQRVDLNNPFAERMAVVIFVAESCRLEGVLTTADHAQPFGSGENSLPRRHSTHGKMAAAGDDTELPLEDSGT